MTKAENQSQWADQGHTDHAELAAQVRSGTLPPDLAALVPAGARAELALAYDVARGEGRIIGEDVGRAYGAQGAFEVFGSTDVGGVDSDAVIVVDWKTGFAEVEPAATNPQLAFYALTLCRALGKNRAIVRVVYTKTGVVDEAELDVLDLAAFANTLASLHPRIAELQAQRKRGEPVPTREGAWCKHCSSKSVCPSKVGLLVQVATQGLAVLGDTEMTPARARAGYEQVVAVEQLAKDARKRLETYVDEQGPIDLGAGRFYGRYHRKGNEKLDGATAVAAIAEVIGEGAREFEAIAIERKVTKAGIDRAAKALFVSGAAKKGAAVVARIRELGGSKRSDERPIGEYSADKHDAAPPPPLDASDIAEMNRMLESA